MTTEQMIEEALKEFEERWSEEDVSDVQGLDGTNKWIKDFLRSKLYLIASKSTEETIPKSQVREAIERAIEENQLIVEKADEKLLRGKCDEEFFTEEDAFLMIEKRLSAVDALTALSKELGLEDK